MARPRDFDSLRDGSWFDPSNELLKSSTDQVRGPVRAAPLRVMSKHGVLGPRESGAYISASARCLPGVSAVRALHAHSAAQTLSAGQTPSGSLPSDTIPYVRAAELRCNAVGAASWCGFCVIRPRDFDSLRDGSWLFPSNGLLKSSTDQARGAVRAAPLRVMSHHVVLSFAEALELLTPRYQRYLFCTKVS